MPLAASRRRSRLGAGDRNITRPAVAGCKISYWLGGKLVAMTTFKSAQERNYSILGVIGVAWDRHKHFSLKLPFSGTRLIGHFASRQAYHRKPTERGCQSMAMAFGKRLLRLNVRRLLRCRAAPMSLPGTPQRTAASRAKDAVASVTLNHSTRRTMGCAGSPKPTRPATPHKLGGQTGWTTLIKC